MNPSRRAILIDLNERRRQALADFEHARRELHTTAVNAVHAGESVRAVAALTDLTPAALEFQVEADLRFRAHKARKATNQ